jgi:serine protease Do
MKTKQILFTVMISAVTAFAVIWGYGKYVKNSNTYAGQLKNEVPSNYKFAGLLDGNGPAANLDFTVPAAAATPAIVHIKTKTNAKQANNNLPRTQRPNPFSDLMDDDMMNQLFGGRGGGITPEQKASGSGVIISQDGYIVTNNHVLENADEIMVTMSNKKNYKAKLIGTDPAYDLAVIKIEAAGLPFLLYGNSDEVKVGQWVLAIGYPLNLETTVTAGIISAKSRSLGLNKSTRTSSAVESFLQTDAAVNMGNSGGALIDTEGKLVGINSAIASPTGYYSGYSYAIPVNIAKKVVDDLIKFGTVQRAFLGISYLPDNSSDEVKKKEGIVEGNGVYVTGLAKGGAAEFSGVKKGDFITKVNGVGVNSSAEMVEQVSRYKPGDKISIAYERDGKETTANITLKNNAGNYDVVKSDFILDALGADLIALDAKKAKQFGVDGGVMVKKINKGVLNDQTRMKDGFVILKVNDKNVKSVEELKTVISNNKAISISGFYPGYDGVYDYQLTLDQE